jgi:hypothetical protein
LRYTGISIRCTMSAMERRPRKLRRITRTGFLLPKEGCGGVPRI